ncbi:MAG TPA: metallophosphoesterase [Polyangia bacterium]|nr:metallophosphoesterase [Polyangia bacterium]
MLTISPKKLLQILAVGTIGLSALVGCGGQPNTVSGGPSGSIALAVQGTPGFTINSFTYSLTGPTSRTGSIDVSNSSSVSTLIGGVAAGTGYAISLTGTSTDGTATCTGNSALFNVTASATTSVAVAIDCHSAPTTGSVAINGTVNVCPSITSVSAAPPAGNLIAITGVASDPDSGPSALTYAWTTSSGTLSSTTAANPTLTCTAPGSVSLTLTASDGDAGCNATFDFQLTCPPDSALGETAWVEIGANNQAIARLLTPYNVCPSITVNGTTSPMTLRVLAGTNALRPTTSDATVAQAMSDGQSKASVFTTSTCEFLVPANATTATVAGISLPLPKATVNRIVVLGDTGCRIALNNPVQHCADPTQWPFPVIAQAAAAAHPDLVLHVGDYHYRENPCPAGESSCVGTVWGYGSDVWMADFFTPAAPLLAAAPWVMVRGNHEACNRAGQGWYRYLDTNLYDSTGVKTCNDSTNDNSGNYNDPLAVSFGDTRFVVFDSSNIAKNAYSPPNFEPYTTELVTNAASLATPDMLNIWTNHHPILGYTVNPLGVGNPAMQSFMNAAYGTNYFPPNIGLALHGHVHDFQALDFASNHPGTIVAGNGGDNLDIQLPSNFDPSVSLPAPGTLLSSFAFSNEFGFMLMDRVGSVGQKTWTFTAYKVDGTVLAACTTAAPPACSGTCDTTAGTRLNCVDKSGVPVGHYDNIP